MGDGSFDKSLAEEMQPGPDLQAEQSAASGMDTEHAGLEARRQFGNSTLLALAKPETGRGFRASARTCGTECARWLPTLRLRSPRSYRSPSPSARTPQSSAF